jgi:hypothetical protein
VHDLGRYLELIVEPTFDEFKKNRASVRHAFLACVAIYHAIDRASYPNKPGNLRKEWGQQSLEFKLVDISAHHFKHVQSSDEIIGVRRPGLPISRALGFNYAGDEMDLRNLFFVIRDAMKFLHQQAGLTITHSAPAPAVCGSQQSLTVEMSPATLFPREAGGVPGFG